MGPFPHDAPPATITPDNPIGTDGFEFVEFAHPEPEEAARSVSGDGLLAGRPAPDKTITVYRQGDINYLVNEELATHGFDFVAEHGPCAPSMAFRVVDAEARAMNARSSPGAEPAASRPRQKTLDVPAIKGIGGSLLYFVDRYGAKGSPYDDRVRMAGRARSAARGRRLPLSRPPHPQCPSRPHGRVDRLLRGCSTSARSASSTSRASASGLFSPRAHQPCRQDPHPDQRGSADDKARSRNTSSAIAARASSTSPAAPTTSTPTIEPLAANGLQFMPAPPDDLFREDRCAPAEPRRADRADADERHSDRRRGRGRRRPRPRCCCRSSRPM